MIAANSPSHYHNLPFNHFSVKELFHIRVQLPRSRPQLRLGTQRKLIIALAYCYLESRGDVIMSFSHSLAKNDLGPRQR